MNLSKCSKEDLEKSGIYKISNTVNEKIYIGSAVHFKRRINSHKSNFNKQKHNSYFQNFVNKYGIDTLIFEIIEIVMDAENLLIREQYYLDFHKPYLKNIGFNICPIAGNTVGVKMTQSHKDATSKRMKGKQYRLGQKATEETKKLISENSIKFWAENIEKKKEFTEESKTNFNRKSMQQTER
jgi:group I intron endonuclease